MIHVFHIDDSRPGAKAFLEFMRTLDFVEEENEDSLTSEQHEAIENGLKSLKKKGGKEHDAVMSDFKKKYPHFFRA